MTSSITIFIFHFCFADLFHFMPMAKKEEEEEVEGGLVSGAGAIQELTLHFPVSLYLCEPYVIETYFKWQCVVQSRRDVMFCPHCFVLNQKLWTVLQMCLFSMTVCSASAKSNRCVGFVIFGFCCHYGSLLKITPLKSEVFHIMRRYQHLDILPTVEVT